MVWIKRIPAVAMFWMALIAVPAHAQSRADYVDRVAFYERVVIGEVEITPIGVLQDRRCADYRFCFREDTFVIVAVIHDYRGRSQITLSWDEPLVVPGGYLYLRSAGTRPSRSGAIRLREYAMDFEFIPSGYNEEF